MDYKYDIDKGNFLKQSFVEHSLIELTPPHDFTVEWIMDLIKKFNINETDKNKLKKEILLIFSAIDSKCNLINDFIVEFLMDMLFPIKDENGNRCDIYEYPPNNDEDDGINDIFRFSYYVLQIFNHLSQYRIHFIRDDLFKILGYFLRQQYFQVRIEFLLECFRLLNHTYKDQKIEWKREIRTIVLEAYKYIFKMLMEVKLFKIKENKKEFIQEYIEAWNTQHPFEIRTNDDVIGMGYMMPFLYTFYEISIYLFKLSNENEFIEIVDTFDTPDDAGIIEDTWFNRFIKDNSILLKFTSPDQWRVLNISINIYNYILKHLLSSINTGYIEKMLEFIHESDEERIILSKFGLKNYIEQQSVILKHINLALQLAFNNNRFEIFDFYLGLGVFYHVFEVLKNKYTDLDDMDYISEILKLIAKIPDENMFYTNLLRRKCIMRRLFLTGDKDYFEVILNLLCNYHVCESNLVQRILWIFYCKTVDEGEELSYEDLNETDYNLMLEILLNNLHTSKGNLTVRFYYRLLTITQMYIPELFAHLMDDLKSHLMMFLEDNEDTTYEEIPLLIGFLETDGAINLDFDE
ncbi:MAG: hypothetical protein LBR15_08445 [Methanobrevibacter sp.]|jgi:hypothetical protein|nr:hypothetical protein [Candidatus Methanovirga australis]